jgi:hypothetical protein
LHRIDPIAPVSIEAGSKYPRFVSSAVNPGSTLLASPIRAYPYLSFLALVYYFPSLQLVVSLFVSHLFTLYVELEFGSNCEAAPFLDIAFLGEPEAV